MKSRLKRLQSNGSLRRKIQPRLTVNNASTLRPADHHLQRHPILHSNRPRRDRHLLPLILPINANDQSLVTLLSREHITVIIRKEIDQTPGAHRRVLASKSNPRARPLKHLLLVRLPLLTSKSTLREITTIIRIVASLHPDFFTVVKLRNSTHAQDECDVHHRARGRRALEREKPRRVVIVRKHREFRGIRIERVVFQLL